MLGHHVNRADADPNRLAICLAVADVEAARGLPAGDELAGAMRQAGVHVDRKAPV